MTRINVVNVEELCNQHLFAEWREMPRMVAYLNKSLNSKKPFNINDIPKKYVLGQGHVKFFYDKFKYLHKRHIMLTNELLKRGYNLNYTNSDIFKEVDEIWYNDYTPTIDAITINRKRINDRLNGIKD